MADECKSKGLVDTVLADVMGFSQKETSAMFGISRSAISKRATGENQEEYDNELKDNHARRSWHERQANCLPGILTPD